jgi:hypothetical protein
MASANATTHTHYDVDHNFFVRTRARWPQLACPSRVPPAHTPVAIHIIAHQPFTAAQVQLWGSKQFTIFSPRDADRLYLFPEMHPRARKSQVTLERPDPSLFPRFLGTPHRQVTLHPGDVLCHLRGITITLRTPDD